MKTTHSNSSIKFIKWLSAEDMHNNSKEWLSELEFIKTEHLFLENIINSFALQLIDKIYFSDSKKIIEAINSSIRENEKLIKVIRKHENDLKIMIDEINQPKDEEEYKNEHRNITVIIHKFLKEYKLLKKDLFDMIKKTQKQKRLIN
tara:strand:- start:790 stop:1230 length:441 start_codon:yes stop_codon:yes gene_type:complete